MPRNREINWGDDLVDITLDEPPIDDSSTVDSESPFKEDPGQTGKPSDTDGTELGDIQGRPRRRREETTPRRTHTRKPIDELFSFAWGGVGGMLIATGMDPAVGRAMSFQAPLAGEKLDELVAGTFIDRLIQPLASKGESGKQAFSVLALPLVIGLLERNPGNPLVWQLAKGTVKQNLHALIPVMKKQAQEVERDAEMLEELSDMFEFPEGVDPIEFVLMQILGPIPSPQEAPIDVEAEEAGTPAV